MLSRRSTMLSALAGWVNSVSSSSHTSCIQVEAATGHAVVPRGIGYVTRARTFVPDRVPATTSNIQQV
jgi:hypothetical protein